jgi:prepilin signal peptidase PulO-like enzyme (type II secretory pathway)
VLAAGIMRVFGWTYAVPTSVRAELDALRAKAAAGDKEAVAALADDPMASEGGEGVLAMRLPLGPFLALACIEVLFLRRWLIDEVFAWFSR